MLIAESGRVHLSYEGLCDYRRSYEGKKSGTPPKCFLKCS